MNNRPTYYQNYHKHTSQSHRYNKDSPLVHQDYFNYIKNNCSDVPQIYSTVEHGWQGVYFRVYNDLEQFNKKNNLNIKFVFGTEMYWVKNRFEKDNSNCHIILLAKNDNGRKAINKAISIAYKTGYYYKGRMDIELLLSLPKDDIFVTTACVAFWNKYDDIDDIVLKLNEHFSSFYLEVQPHLTEKQKELNQHILDLHNQYNIPLIAGTDSHIIDKSSYEDREDLLRSNKIHYDDEDGWFLDYPSVDEFIKRFETQGILNQDEIYEAINNTNIILSFEDIILDRTLKVPVLKKYQNLTQEQRNRLFINTLRKEWMNQQTDINKDKLDQYVQEIKHDIKEILDCNMADYFLDNYEIIKRAINNYGGILTPTGRGSGVSMYLNKLLGFTKVDKVNASVLMYSERFLTATRVKESHTPPDIDHNVSEREPFIQAQRDLLGEKGTYDLIALGTLKYKSAFKMYARAYDLDPQIANEVSSQITKYEEALKYAEDEEDKELISIYDYVDKEKYSKLIEGCKQYKGIVDNIKGHPCGTICSDRDIESDIGVIMCKSETTGKETLTAVIESGTIDSFGYLKQDYLVVDSIGLMYDIYKEMGIKPLTINQLTEKIENNQDVWDIYKNGKTICINQCEQEGATKKVMKYQPHNISELTQFIAAIRPSFKTMYKTFENRQPFEYGIKAFDTLLQDEYCHSSFILYQESLMKVLGFAGFPMSETYTIIKAISKKKDYIIKDAKKKFIPNFMQAILKTKETDNENQAKEMAGKVWQIIENSAQYGFNSAHAYSMALDSVTLAWQKATNPLAFYKVTLQRYTNKGNKNKVNKIKKEMIDNGIKLNPIKFGDDNRKFTIDEQNQSINQTMASIKGMSKNVPDILYELKDTIKTKKDLMIYLSTSKKDKKIDSKSLDILFKLNYFKCFGDINQLIYENTLYDKFYTSKILTKSKLSDIENKAVQGCFKKESEKQYREIDNVKFIENIITLTHISPSTQQDAMKWQIQLLGYTDIKIESASIHEYMVESIEVDQWGRPWADLYNIKCGVSKNIEINKRHYHGLEQGDIIKAIFGDKKIVKFMGKDDKGKNIYKDTGQTRRWVTNYEKEGVK